jgi:site-specific DNA recombinase
MFSKRTESLGSEKRCAIYTRRSLDLDVEQEFNSLEAQRSICSAYIASQRPNGWVEIPKRYDDAGRTGANLQRPALQELLTDLESGLVDVIVIYKLDRITRTLLDFVRLVDLFEQFGVHFVSVTQNFDTADSTGRLILNILLTFAQFEREISSDRLRDKFRAMKQRGMFVGGHPPYGFDLVDKKLVPRGEEAKVVRWIFRRYLRAKSSVKIAAELKSKDICRRTRISKRGNVVAGRYISASSVLNMISNPIYCGQVRYHGDVYPGRQEGIVSESLWEQVRLLRAERTRAKVIEIHKDDLLRGLMFDSYGRSIGVFRDYRRNQAGTRYYRSNQTEWGRRNKVRGFRTKADALDQLVLGAVCALLSDRPRLRVMLLNLGVHDSSLNKLSKAGSSYAKTLERSMPRFQQCALKAIIERIEISDDGVQIVLRVPEVHRFLTWSGIGFFRGDPDTWSRPHRTELIDIPTSTVRMKRDLQSVFEGHCHFPKRKRNAYLVHLIQRARRAQRLLDERCEEPLHSLAAKFQVTDSRFPRLVRLNYLAPDIIASIFDGTQPADLTGHKLMATDLPLDWSLQRRLLGYPGRPDLTKAAPGW